MPSHLTKPSSERLQDYEARKAQENAAIQTEAERAAAEYAARISRNLDEVAREKDTFRKWQAKSSPKPTAWPRP